MDTGSLDVASLRQSLEQRLTYSVGKDKAMATPRDWFYATAYMTRDHLIARWMQTMRSYYAADAKRVYYLSMEFLMGRTLMNSLLNLGMEGPCQEALRQHGVDLHQIREIEHDAALGNGGLGRLAACFLDSMATLGLPGYGYGIRYEYGMFSQKIEHGRQVEHPDNWLRYGNPWEFARPEVLYQVKFGGRVVAFTDHGGALRHHWVDTEDVMAMAYDTPIPGYATATVNNMRLWAAKSSRDFDLKYFNEGNYIRAVEDKNSSENLSKVLYPDDSTAMGRALRLKQQYFFVCASLQDILFRFSKSHADFDALPDKVAIQLNDTHPAVGIAELMRLLVDVHHLPWERAWEICARTFSYTNHTLMAEALETWPVALFEQILPRHLQIIYEINARFLTQVMQRFPGDNALCRRMSIIGEDDGRRVRMAHLAMVGSHTVNGVAQLHTELMKQTIFADFERFYPGKIVNVTNGVTPRRWLHQANPLLSELISARIGSAWRKDLSELERLVPVTEDVHFRQQLAAVKRADKERFALEVQRTLGETLRVDSLFDVQIKRMHEYKRQFLNVLHVITLYRRICNDPQSVVVPRTVIISGKAAPAYFMAKLVIQLISGVAAIVNHDPRVQGRLKLLFVPNYSVSVAEMLIPAADLSQQISTAGTEASGTGNMKLALNGALTIGTLDGANIEIRDAVGADNMFIFGLDSRAAADLRASGYKPRDYYQANGELAEVLDMVGGGFFSPDEPARFRPIVDSLLVHGDHYLLLADYGAYIAAQGAVEQAYADQELWLRKAILNIAHMGPFSSDRTVQQYARDIWHTRAVLP